MVKCMLVDVCCKKGVGVCVDEQNNVVESFVFEDLFFVVFENGKCIVELNVKPEMSLVIDGSGVELVIIG